MSFQVMEAITSHLGLGSYSTWPEETKVQWLTNELISNRPLLNRNMQLDCSPEVQEALDTFRVIAEVRTRHTRARCATLTRVAWR